MGYIYKIYNDVNDKIYIGLTTHTIEYRWKEHCVYYNKNYENVKKNHLYRAMLKYGIENFHVEFVEEVDNALLDEREKYWIKYYDSFHNGYNSTLGGKLVTLLELDELKIIQEYLTLKSARKVAIKNRVDHSTINKILHENNIRIFTKEECVGRGVTAIKGDTKLHFNSVMECAQYLLDNGETKSKSTSAIRSYISSVIHGRKKDYYGWVFIGE